MEVVGAGGEGAGIDLCGGFPIAIGTSEGGSVQQPAEAVIYL